MGHKPSTPTYDTNSALLEQNRVNLASANQKYADVNSPMGGYSVSVDPLTGQMTVNKALSENSQNALNQQMQVLRSYTGDGTDAANAYYDAQMAYLQPQMQRQTTRAETALTNRGIPIGGSAWNEYMGDVRDVQNQQLSGLGSSALSAGQGYQNNILGQANMLGSQVVDPTMISGQGGAGLYDMYEQQYQNAIDTYKTKMAKYNAKQQAWVNALNPIGAAAGSYIGGNNTTGNLNGAISAQQTSNPYFDGAIDYGQAMSAANMIN